MMFLLWAMCGIFGSLLNRWLVKRIGIDYKETTGQFLWSVTWSFIIGPFSILLFTIAFVLIRGVSSK